MWNRHTFVLDNGDTITYSTQMDEETARQMLVFGLSEEAIPATD
jgi:hypothetical protein